MYNYIKQLFFSKKNDNSIDVKNNSINIDILDKHPYLKILVFNTSNDDAKILAEVIHDINSGLYLESIVTTLIEMSKKDQDIYKFVSNVFLELKKLHKTNDSMINSTLEDNEPEVKPTHFHSMVRHE
jgi:hypothetical protein